MIVSHQLLERLHKLKKTKMLLNFIQVRLINSNKEILIKIHHNSQIEILSSL